MRDSSCSVKVGAGETAIAGEQSQGRNLWRGGAPNTVAACKPQAGERLFAGQRSGAAAAGQEQQR